MSGAGLSELRDRLTGAWVLPYGRAQIAAAEELIRQIDAQRWDHLRYPARMLATHAYVWGGEPAKAYVTFSWCCAAYDRGQSDPSYDEDLYWQFKWLIGRMLDFPELSLGQLRAALDDMQRRYRLAGHTMGPVHQLRMRLARHLGEVAMGEEQYRLWRAAPRGDMSDCAQCEPESMIVHLMWRERYEDAIAVADPVLRLQTACTEQPHRMLATLLPAYLHTGRLDEAVAAHHRAYRAVRSRQDCLDQLGRHLRFCAQTGNETRGLQLLQRHLGWLDEAPSPADAMWFATSAALLLGRVVRLGLPNVALRRPAWRDRDATEVTVAALAEELTAQALELAGRFDARNGSCEQGRQVRAALAAEPVVQRLPLFGS